MKNPPKLKFLMLYLKQKLIYFTKIICFSHAFEIFIPRSTLSFGSSTNSSLRGRKNFKNEHFEAIVLKQNWMSATKVICVFWVNLSGSYLEQKIHFLEMCAHVSLKITTNDSFRGK